MIHRAVHCHPPYHGRSIQFPGMLGGCMRKEPWSPQSLIITNPLPVDFRILILPQKLSVLFTFLGWAGCITLLTLIIRVDLSVLIHKSLAFQELAAQVDDGGRYVFLFFFCRLLTVVCIFLCIYPLHSLL